MVKCCDIKAGDLTRLIEIQRFTATPDGEGGQTDTWAADPPGGIWASVKALSGGERWIADRTTPGNKYRIVIRHRDDGSGNPYYSGADRVLLNGRELAILSVVDVEGRRRWNEIIAVENGKS